jgi:hypothetical protein
MDLARPVTRAGLARGLLRLQGMPFARTPTAEPMTRRDLRVVIAAGVLVLLVLAAVAIWAAVRPGSYGGSRNGCITVTMPSSTGGALIHDCGASARRACQQAYAGHDRVSLLTRPQCKLAGLAPN